MRRVICCYKWSCLSGADWCVHTDGMPDSRLQGDRSAAANRNADAGLEDFAVLLTSVSF